MVPERSFVGALPVIQCIFSTSSAVARCFGSMVSSACTRLGLGLGLGFSLGLGLGLVSALT